jgi:hypothetical protein
MCVVSGVIGIEPRGLIYARQTLYHRATFPTLFEPGSCCPILLLQLPQCLDYRHDPSYPAQKLFFTLITERFSFEHWWLMPVILSSQEQRIGGLKFEANSGK